LVPSAFTMFIPFVASRSAVLFVICRVLTGVAAGATFPTIYLMVSGWAPTAEKATAISIVLSGSNIGTIIIDTLGPRIMESFGWPFVFYFSGGAGFVWVIFWYTVVADTPNDTKNIHPNERDYILGKSEYQSLLANKGKTNVNTTDKDPDGADLKLEKYVEKASEPNELLDNKEALSILTKNSSFWFIVWGGFCTNWGIYIFLTWLPTYVHSDLDFDVQWSGIIAITPNISGAIYAFLSGKVCDAMLARGFDKLRVRKGFFNVGCAMYALTLVILALKDTLHIPNLYAAIILAFGTGGAGFWLPGYSANIYDLAPYHPSLVVGISNTFGTIPGIVGVFLTGVLLEAGLGWSSIWLMTASFYILAMIGSFMYQDVKRLV